MDTNLKKNVIHFTIICNLFSKALCGFLIISLIPVIAIAKEGNIFF